MAVMSKSQSLFLFAVASGTLGGCGLTVPEMQEFYQATAEEKFDENVLVSQIKCEIHKGVQDTLDAFQFSGTGPYTGNSIDWLKNWAAKVTLKITVDEKSALAPGVTLNKPLHNAVSHFNSGGNVTTPQSFSTSIGLQVSADATRIETIGFTYVFANLLKEPLPEGNKCDHVSKILIMSDLKIGDFIINKATIANVPGTILGEKSSGPFTAFSDQITFVVIYGGNVTPIWKLVNITGSSNSPFFNATRSRTHDVTITLGPLSSPTVDAIHQANLIGQAVATAIQSQQH